MTSTKLSSAAFILRRAVLTRCATFRGDRRGNVAMMFGLVLVPLIGMVGAAIDYTRAAAVQASLQAALDATALAISKSATAMTSAQVQSAAQTFFSGVFSVSGITTPTVTAVYTPASTSNATVKVSATLAVPMSFMAVVGINTTSVSGSSTTTWGMTRLRVALALDNTGSMADSGKIGALQTATKNLLNQLKAAAVNNGDVYVSIVPFAKVVNVGTSSSTKTWIDWSNWDPSYAPAPTSAPATTVGPGSSCPYSFSGCLASPGSSTSVSTIPSTGAYTGYICPRGYSGCFNSVAGTQTCTTFWGHTTCTTPYTHAWIPDRSSWDGTVMDRTQNYDTTNTMPDTATQATLFPASQGTSGDPTPLAMIPLTYSWTDLTNEVNNMSPGGGTNQAIGLAWAWQSLTSGAPLSAPAEDPTYNYTHVIILLSDGLNTEDRWYGNGSTQSTQVDARQKILCDNIKAAGATIWAVQVDTGGDPTSSVMQYCASDSGKFVLLTSANQIVTTFQQIGVNLSQLRIAK
jgi:Flp pilus assembly protein TadG